MRGHVAVIDIGKTNLKLALVDPVALREVAVVTTPNRVIAAPPWPQFDLEAHWAFILRELAGLNATHRIEGLAVTTHGASGVLLGPDGQLAAPMLDYEHDGPDVLAAEYDRLRPDFALTGSPRLPMGLNLGAQLHWQLACCPELRGRVAHVLTYPQYWGWRLTGEMACDVSSLGCHTDLWDPWRGQPSDLMERLGLGGRLAAPRAPTERLGGLCAEVAGLTGIPRGTPVAVGIHDSNASLLPQLRARRGQAFSVVSSGTWVISMAVRGRQTGLDPARDTLVNVSAEGEAVPSARFMGGREVARMRETEGLGAPRPEDRDAVLGQGIRLMPSLSQGSGPWPRRQPGWSRPPATPGQRMYALALHQALMTRSCLDLIGATGPVIAEGPFAGNADWLAMLAALSPAGVERAASGSTGTSIGTAMLLLAEARAAPGEVVPLPPEVDALRDYAALWRAEAEKAS